MNRSDVVKAVAGLKGVPQSTVTEVMDGMLDVVALSLACDEDVLLSGFGRFEVRTRPPTTRRNPRTGESVEVGERRSLRFKPSTQLKDRLNGKQ